MSADLDSKARDTGTAVGVAVELYHRGHRWAAIERLTRAASRGGTERRPFAGADLDEALRAARRYASDPRNPVEIVERESLERRVELRLEPHHTDPTGEPVYLRGHLDQLRHAGGGVLELWDVKHSHRVDPRDLPMSYAAQLALYVLAANATLGRPVRLGGIISTREYLRRGRETDPSAARAFLPLPWRLEDCEALASLVVERVADIRAGRPRLSPGPHCGFCPSGGFPRCREKMAAGE